MGYEWGFFGGTQLARFFFLKKEKKKNNFAFDALRDRKGVRAGQSVLGVGERKKPFF